MRELPALLNQLEEAGGPPAPVPSADGWELVLAENVAYLVDDRRRWEALAELRRVVGLAPEQILAAPEAVLIGIVAGARRWSGFSACAGAPSWRSLARPGALFPASALLGPTASTCAPGPPPCSRWTPTACGCRPDWATATRAGPTPPATGEPRPPRARSCP
jgi:hypothetical protein